MTEFAASSTRPFDLVEREEKWIQCLDINVTFLNVGETEQSFISLLKSSEDLSLHNSSELSDARRRTRADDKRTIHQDILRTRADDVFFRSKIFLLKRALEAFCVYHRVNYMQGLNEILAPIMTIGRSHQFTAKSDTCIHLDEEADEDGQSSYREQLSTFGINLLMFEQLVKKLCPATFASKGVNALQSQLTSFHLILTYHDPLLSIFLRDRDMTPDIYAMSWFITLFARKTPINIVLCLWDIMLQLGDPINLIFIAVAFLCSYREEILLHSNESLPQRLVSFCFQSEEHVKAVTSNALRLKLLTPLTVQTESSKLGFRAKLNEYEREFGIHDLMNRPCLFVDSSEVVQSMLRSPKYSCVYTFLDCRHSKSASSVVQFRNRIQITTEIQDEICSAVAKETKARRKIRENALAGKFLSAEEVVGSSSSKASGLVSVLSLEACTLLSLLCSACADSSVNASSSSGLPLHLVILDDYVPELPDLSLFGGAVDSELQQAGVDDEFSSPSITPYASPKKTWSARNPRATSSDSMFGLNTAYRRSPTYSASKEGGESEQQDHTMRDFYSSWILGMNSKIALISGTTSFSKSTDRQHHPNQTTSLLQSAKGKKNGDGKFSAASSPRATGTSVHHEVVVDSAGEVLSSDRAHAFASALVILGFPRVSILQHNLLPPASSEESSMLDSKTSMNTSENGESGELSDEKYFSDVIQGMFENNSRSPVQAMARDMFEMKTPIQKLKTHSFKSVNDIASAMYHFPTASIDGNPLCMACEKSSMRPTASLPPSTIEFCLPMNYIFLHKVLCFILNLLSHASTIAADNIAEVRSRYEAENDTDLYLNMKRKSLGKLVLQMLDDRELLDSRSTAQSDNDAKPEPMDGEFLLIRSVDLTGISDDTPAEDGRVSIEDSMSLKRLFSHLQSLSTSSTTMQATILLVLVSQCLMDSTADRVTRAVILLQRLLCHGQAQRSCLRYILQCTRAAVTADGTATAVADILSLIEDLQAKHLAIETTERVKKKLDLVSEKAQMTSYKILQSKALTKYARNRVRSLLTTNKEPPHDGK